MPSSEENVFDNTIHSYHLSKIKNNPNHISNIPQSLQNENFYMEALHSNPLCFKYINHQSIKLIKEATKLNSININYVDTNIAKINKMSVTYIPETNQQILKYYWEDPNTYICSQVYL